jgi:hypothetical protein
MLNKLRFHIAMYLFQIGVRHKIHQLGDVYFYIARYSWQHQWLKGLDKDRKESTP